MHPVARLKNLTARGSFVLLAALLLSRPNGMLAQPGQGQSAANGSVPAPGARASAIAVPADYVIGPDDVLSIVFWRDREMSAQVRVRPDGQISLPLLNDVMAVGLTPAQLRDELEARAKKFLEDPNGTVVVVEINSRRVFVTGEVARPGSFSLNSPMTVLQAIALAGGVLEYADAESIAIMRSENGRTVRLRFNYKAVIKGKRLEQNVSLKPGDTIVVP